MNYLYYIVYIILTVIIKYNHYLLYYVYNKVVAAFFLKIAATEKRQKIKIEKKRQRQKRQKKNGKLKKNLYIIKKFIHNLTKFIVSNNVQLFKIIPPIGWISHCSKFIQKFYK
jgi:hypothetical protein